ncbi:glycosyltransferase [Pleurocapsales cyanobacterium LEGE 06147]|nr:glycosyltransferase [Pleurocapsales cyanobacterium LEGE 06147]
MKILMLSSTFPYPPTKGGTQVRTFNLLRHLNQKHHVTLVTQKDNEIPEETIVALRGWVTELKVFPREPVVEGGILNKIERFGKFWQQGTPPNVLHSYSVEIQKWIDKAVVAGKFEAITCEHSVNEIYVRPQWKRHLQTVVNIHSSVYRTCQNQLATATSENKLRDRLYLPLLLRYEKRFCQKFSQIVVTTEEDRQQILTFNSQSKVAVIPNGVDLVTFPYRNTDPGGRQLIFFGGMDYIANIDAACFFSREILPILQAKYPGTTLTVVGSNPTPKVLALAELPGIRVTGRVTSIAEYLHRATICVVPMRTGFGIKNKTLEAMAAGTPVVGSDRGLEGIEVDRDGVPLRALRANRVDEYVEAISRLFADAELRATLSHNARAMIEREYSWPNLAKRYEQVIIDR